MKNMTISPERLIANGFLSTTYEGEEGIYYTKTLKAGAMPKFSRNSVDDETISADDDIVVEVCQDGKVQLVDQTADYYEAGIPLNAPEGRALLEDAGFRFN